MRGLPPDLPTLWLMAKTFGVKPKVVDGEHVECGGVVLSQLTKNPWPKVSLTETSNQWQRECFYVMEPRSTKWAATPAFRSGPPLQLASWINKGLVWGSVDELQTL